MRSRQILLPFAILLASCSTDAVLPTPEGESGAMIVTFASGGVDTMSIEDLHVHADTVVVGEDTTYCLTFYAEGPGATPGEGEDPTVDLVNVMGCGSSFDVPPSHWVRAFGSGDDISSTSRASTVAYYADSGSAKVERLGGGFAEVTLFGRYRAEGSDLPPAYRIDGHIIVQWQAEVTEE